MATREPMLKEAHVFCPVCKTLETIELYDGLLHDLGYMGKEGRGDGVLRYGKFWQEGFEIYHCKGKPVMEIK